MEANTITCPKCQHTFPLTSAIEQPIVERLRAKFEADTQQKEAGFKQREGELARQTEELTKQKENIQDQIKQKVAEERKKISAEQEKKAKEAVGIQLADLQEQLSEKNKKLKDAEQLQLDLMKQKRSLEDEKQSFELEKAKLIEAERDKIRAEAKKSALETAALEKRELEEKLSAKEDALKKAQEAELALRKEKAAFEEQKKAFELEIARRTDEATQVVAKAKDEEFRLKEAEKNKQMDDMKRQIDELKRKAEQGSQQAQGEVLELDLEQALRRCFPDDEFTPVAKGVHGGDILQQVRDDAGRNCGTIIWESKRTKAWSDGWLDKLKDDKLAAKAPLAVLISAVLPKGMTNFECRDNIWIAPPNLAVPLAGALRTILIETAVARKSVENRHDKMEVMYAYLSGPEFKGKVTSIVETFSAMRDDLETEKKAIQKIWARREKQLDRVLANTSGMYGDLSGIIGKSLPTIERLELTSILDGDGDGTMNDGGDGQ